MDDQRQQKVSALEAQRDLLVKNGSLLNNMAENEERVKLHREKEKRLQKDNKILNKQIAAMSRDNTELKQRMNALEQKNNETEENEKRLIESANAAKAASRMHCVENKGLSERVRSLEAEVDKRKRREDAACKKRFQAEKERDTMRKRHSKHMAICPSVFPVGVLLA